MRQFRRDFLIPGGIVLTQVNAVDPQVVHLYGVNDPTTFREMASFWRDMAGLGESRLREERLKLADWFERQAAEHEAKHGGHAKPEE